MIAVELLSIKLQELFGKNYKILPYAQLCNEYTTARQVIENGNIGYVQDYTDDYAKLRQEKIVGIVNLLRPTRANTSVYYVTSDFNIDFAVPVNVLKKDINGSLIENPKVNFFNDCEEVLSNLIDKEIEFVNEYHGAMVISEPVYLQQESDGLIKYAIYRVSGTFNVSDSANFGSKYKVALFVDNEFVELDGVNNYSETLDNNTNAISKNGKARLEQNIAQSSYVVSIGIDDIESENKARQFIYDVIHNNLEILNEEQSESLKRKVKVKTTTPSGTTREFWAIMSVTFKTNRNNVGSYAISFTDDNKG